LITQYAIRNTEHAYVSAAFINDRMLSKQKANDVKTPEWLAPAGPTLDIYGNIECGV
jgi:hypothetical protein